MVTDPKWPLTASTKYSMLVSIVNMETGLYYYIPTSTYKRMYAYILLYALLIITTKLQTTSTNIVQYVSSQFSKKICRYTWNLNTIIILTIPVSETVSSSGIGYKWIEIVRSRTLITSLSVHILLLLLVALSSVCLHQSLPYQP